MEDLSGVRLKSHAPFLEEGERVIALSYSASSAAIGCAIATFDFGAGSGDCKEAGGFISGLQ